MTFAARRSARILRAITPVAREPADEVREAVTSGVTSAKPISRRFAQRKACATPAHLLFDGSRTPIPCTLLDTSSTGALIGLTPSRANPVDAEGLPAEFTLVLQHDRVEMRCRVARRGENEVGVRYISPARPLGSHPKPMIRKPK